MLSTVFLPGLASWPQEACDERCLEGTWFCSIVTRPGFLYRLRIQQAC